MFEIEDSYARLDKAGDPLLSIKEVVNWEELRPLLKSITFKPTSKGGRPGTDPLIIVRCLILQEYYQLGDGSLEYQINDRLSFKRFIGVDVNEKAPDEKTIWLYRERMKTSVGRQVFDWFLDQCARQGYSAQKGQIIDATFVPTHKPTGKHKAQFKEEIPLTPHQHAPIDTDATHTKKGDQKYHGYKNHIDIDNKHKLIRDFDVTTASTHDSQVFEDILDDTNTGRDVFADSAYRSEKSEKVIKEKKLHSKVHYRAYRNKPLSEAKKRTNKKRSETRAPVEHVFGHMTTSMNGLMIHTIGLARAKLKLTFKNLAYNMHRVAFLGRKKSLPKCA